jgi:hypothetical protein
VAISLAGQTIPRLDDVVLRNRTRVQLPVPTPGTSTPELLATGPRLRGTVAGPPDLAQRQPGPGLAAHRSRDLERIDPGRSNRRLARLVDPRCGRAC